jgi:hypothetical protein
MKGRGELEASETVATILLALTVITMGDYAISPFPAFQVCDNAQTGVWSSTSSNKCHLVPRSSGTTAPDLDELN